MNTADTLGWARQLPTPAAGSMALRDVWDASVIWLRDVITFAVVAASDSGGGLADCQDVRIRPRESTEQKGTISDALNEFQVGRRRQRALCSQTRSRYAARDPRSQFRRMKAKTPEFKKKKKNTRGGDLRNTQTGDRHFWHWRFQSFLIVTKYTDKKWLCLSAAVWTSRLADG